MTGTISAAVRFFAANAGYSTPPGRMVCAKQLAEAEAWAEDSGLEYVWQDDDEIAYCCCGDPHCKYHEGSKHDWSTDFCRLIRLCPEHGYDCLHAEVVASLGGIIDPSDEYRRVVQAELALEVMPR